MEPEEVRHLGCTSDQIGKYVFLPGDPERSKLIASYFDEPEMVASKREFITYSGWLDGTKVSVTSTGIGGPSAAIAMEELVKLGAHTFIRVGTCGAIQEELEPGTLIIPTAAIRKEGTSREYLPLEFPAVANFPMADALRAAAVKLQHPYAMGVVETKDSYYGQHEPDRMPVREMLLESWQAWKRGGALASEMETATLFIVAAALQVRCASILLLYRNREREKAYGTLPVCSDTVPVAVETAIEAMRFVIKQDLQVV